MNDGDTHERPLAVFAALASNLGIAIAKFVAAGITGSSAIDLRGDPFPRRHRQPGDAPPGHRALQAAG